MEPQKRFGKGRGLERALEKDRCYPAHKLFTSRSPAPAIVALPRPLPGVAVFALGDWCQTMQRSVMILVIALSLTGCGAPDPATTLPTAVIATEAPRATATTAPTEAPVLTNTPAPTATPAPTNTPAPSTTPSPIPATPVPPVVFSGKGQTVTDPFTPPGSINRVTFTHQGRRNFIVQVFGSTGSEGSMVNEIGNYQGIRPLLADEDQYYFEVNADGAWTIRVEAITADPDAAHGISGKGDYVSGLFEPSATGPVAYNLTHSGTRNFIVNLYCAGGEDGVENEIGKVDGSVVVRFKDGPCFWDVQADGDWTITPK